MSYEKKLDAVLKKFNFIEKKILRANFVDGHFAVLGFENSEEVLFKIAFKRNQTNSANLWQEAEAGKVIFAYNSLHRKKISAIETLRSGKEKDFVWLMRKFNKGDVLSGGGSNDRFTLWGYDIIKQKYLGEKVRIVKEIVENIKLFEDIDKKLVKKNGISFSTRFKINLEDLPILKLEKEIGFSLQKQLAFYQQIKKSYLAKENLRFCHGDLVPPNILISPAGKVLLSDFAFFCHDSRFLDVVLFWLFLWRYPDWQKLFLAKFITNSSDEDYFRASLIREILSLGWGKRLVSANHIWLRYLQAAGESFEAIINVK